MKEETEMTKKNYGQICVITPSLKPGENLESLLDSLVESHDLISEIIIVDQSPENLAKRIAENFIDRSGILVRTITSSPGLSHARNMGLKSISKVCDVIILPDDDVTVSRASLSAVLNEVVAKGTDAGSGILLSGPDRKRRINFPNTACDITMKNVWHTSIEAGYFFRPCVFETIGYYDESLGLGAPTPWQSGEGTDLLLRVIKSGKKVRFSPDYLLFERTVDQLEIIENRARVRKYARGTGRVFRNQYSRSDQILLIVRSMAKVVLGYLQNPERGQIALEVLRGRVEGLSGKLK